mgnify:CR=1 FL=1
MAAGSASRRAAISVPMSMSSNRDRSFIVAVPVIFDRFGISPDLFGLYIGIPPIGFLTGGEPAWPDLQEHVVKIGSAELVREGAAGTVISYGELAIRAGRVRAVRAAGSACARNAVAPFVPCHRVVAAGGGLGGYGYGLAVKEALLAHEAGVAALR